MVAFLSKPWGWLVRTWGRFEAWCAKIAPGVKTYTTTLFGAIGSAAGMLQEYFTGLPLSTYVSAEQVTIITLVVFTLAFWFRRLTDLDSGTA